MPLYEYRCSKCNHVFEVISSFTANTPQLCPHCGNKQTVRILSATAPAPKSHPTGCPGLQGQSSCLAAKERGCHGCCRKI